MILATLGSNKLVTTLDAIMTEIFTGIRPDKILILSEEARDLDLTGVMKSFRINAETKVLELGVGINNWREKVKDISIDVADITVRPYTFISIILCSFMIECRDLALNHLPGGSWDSFEPNGTGLTSPQSLPPFWA